MVPSGKIYCQYKKYYESGFGADGENEMHP